MLQTCLSAMPTLSQAANLKAKSASPEELDAWLWPYVCGYAEMIWGFWMQPYRPLLPDKEDLKFSHSYRTKDKLRQRKRRKAYRRKISRKETREIAQHLIALREQIHKTCTFDEIWSVTNEAAWITIKNYDKSSPHFWLYFVRYFRWKVSLLLSRHLRDVQFYYPEHVTCELTTPSIDCIISYSELNDWDQYLFWMSQIENLSARQIEKLTGISKTVIAEEVKSVCYVVAN